MNPTIEKVYSAAKMSGNVDDCRFIEGAKHFVASERIAKTVGEMSASEMLKPGDDPMVFPTASRLPAKSIVLASDGLDGHVICLWEIAGGGINLLYTDGVERSIGYTFFPGTSYMGQEGDSPDPEVRRVFEISLILSLINEPRLVLSSSRAATRQQRRRFERTHGRSAMAWVDVTWTVGKSVKATCSEGAESHRKPLHWSRAHWRKSEESEASSVWVDAHYGPGWYKWIKDSWKGHPDFGIKLGGHNPIMDGDRVQVDGAPSQVPPERLKFMDGAKRAALVVAGYA